MDPPIVPEFLASQMGAPLQQQCRAVEATVREMVDQVHQVSPTRTGDPSEMPYTAYGPPPPEGVTAYPPGIFIRNVSSNRPFLDEIRAIHQLQQTNIQRAEERREMTRPRKGKGRGKGKNQPPVAVHRFMDTDTQCTICLET